MIGRTIDQLGLGDRGEFTKTVSESDIYLYAGLTGDLNPAHINETYAKKTFFEGRIAHGMLILGFISTVLGTQLPGPGTIHLRQEANFLAPVHIGDTITAQVELVEIMAEKKQARFKTICVNQEGTKVLDGEAVVSPPRPPKV